MGDKKINHSSYPLGTYSPAEESNLCIKWHQQNSTVGSSEFSFTTETLKSKQKLSEPPLSELYQHTLNHEKKILQNGKPILGHFYMPLLQLLPDTAAILVRTTIFSRSGGSRADLIHGLCIAVLSSLGTTWQTDDTRQSSVLLHSGMKPEKWYALLKNTASQTNNFPTPGTKDYSLNIQQAA